MNLLYTHSMTQKVFIVGCQRSGTTLTGQVLGAHPNAVLVDEHDGLAQWIRADFDQRTAIVRSFFQWRSMRSARKKYRNGKVQFTRFGRARPHVCSFVFKAPNLTFSAVDIARTNPGSPIVYLVRDIRDVVASMREAGTPIVKNQSQRIRALPDLERRFPRETDFLMSERTSDCVRLASIAVIKMSLAQDFVQLGLPTMILRYEDLATEPDLWIARLMEHVGLRGLGSEIAHHLALTGVGPGGTWRDRPIDTKSIGRWRRSLSAAEEADVYAIAGELNESMGYQRDGLDSKRPAQTASKEG